MGVLAAFGKREQGRWNKSIYGDRTRSGRLKTSSQGQRKMGSGAGKGSQVFKNGDGGTKG